MSNDLTEIEKKRFDALVKESDHIAAGIRGIQDAHRRIIGFLLPGLAFGLPLLLKPSDNVPTALTASIFIGFGFMFLFLVTNYVGLTRHILLLSKYQMEYLAPNINAVIHTTDTDLPVFFWETYVRQKGRQPTTELLGYVLFQGAEFMMLFSSSLGCFSIGLYYLLDLRLIVICFLTGVSYLAILIVTLSFAWLTMKQSRVAPKF